MKRPLAIRSVVRVALGLAILTLLAALSPHRPASAQTVATTIRVGEAPVGVAINPTTNRVYVANSTANSVSVIDATTDQVVTTVTVGTSPRAVAVNPTTNRVYVANRDGNSVSVIDGSTNTVTATVSLGSQPQGVAVNASTNRVYVARADSSESVVGGTTNVLSVIDGSTNSIVATVETGGRPLDVAVNPLFNLVYVANERSSVAVVGGVSNTVVGRVSVGTRPRGIAANTSTNFVYVANQESNNVSVLAASTSAVVATVSVGTGPVGVAVSSATNRVYVTNSGANSVSVIDGANNTVAATVAVGTSPQGVAVHPTTGRAYVANSQAATVSVIQDVRAVPGGRNLTLTSLGGGPMELTWDAGEAQAAYRLFRVTGAGFREVLPAPPRVATSAFDVVPATDPFACYLLLALSATGSVLATADLMCAVPRVAAPPTSGAAPARFGIRLGQSNTASLSWVPPSGHTSQLLLILETTRRSQTLDATARTATDNTRGTATCYLLVALTGSAVSGNSDILCGLPGASSFPTAAAAP